VKRPPLSLPVLSDKTSPLLTIKSKRRRWLDIFQEQIATAKSSQTRRRCLAKRLVVFLWHLLSTTIPQCEFIIGMRRIHLVINGWGGYFVVPLILTLSKSHVPYYGLFLMQIITSPCVCLVKILFQAVLARWEYLLDTTPLLPSILLWINVHCGRYTIVCIFNNIWGSRYLLLLCYSGNQNCLGFYGKIQ